MNRKYDYRALESEYVGGSMSVRALATQHGIGNPSLLHAQARRRDWYTKREAVQQRTTRKLVERLSDAGVRRAERVMEVEDHAVELISQALTKFREDMNRTHMVRHGEQWFEEPLFYLTPKDVVPLLDWLQALINSPGRIVEQRSVGLTVPSDLSLDVLKEFAKLTRENGSPLAVRDVLPSGPRH